MDCIIIAEDSAPNRTVLALLLKRLGFDVIECDDGRGVWRALAEIGERNVVALVSDLMMPEMDGLELLRRVRNSEKWKDLPFVLVTAVSDQDYINEAKALRANGYILKPVTYKRVADKVQQLFPDRIFPKLAS